MPALFFSHAPSFENSLKETICASDVWGVQAINLLDPDERRIRVSLINRSAFP